MSVIENIAVTEENTLISLHGSPADIGMVSKIFSMISAENIDVDMISQSPQDGRFSDLSFTVNDSDFVSAELLRQMKIFRESKAREPVILLEEQMEDTVYSRLKPKKKKKELAEELGVSRTTLWRMAKRQSELEQKQREQEISKRRSE